MFFFLYKYASILNLSVFIFLDVVIDDNDDDDGDDNDDDDDDDDDDFIFQHYFMSHTFDKIYNISLKL